MFYQKVDRRQNKAIYEFLSNHYTYYTMNSWNGLKSVANNVKIYNLKLEDSYKAYEVIETEDFWYEVNSIIGGWLYTHKGYDVFFNGRSSGYLVLGNSENNRNAIDEEIFNCGNYEEYLDQKKEQGYSKSDIRQNLLEYLELVQDFDKLTDEIRDFLIHCCKNCEVVEEEYQVTEKRTVLKEKD